MPVLPVIVSESSPPSRSVVTPLGAAVESVSVSAPAPPNHVCAPPTGVAASEHLTVPVVGVVHAAPVVASASGVPPTDAAIVKLEPPLERPNVSPAELPTMTNAGSGVGVVANGE